jgi:adenylosuccinate lyase
MVEAAWFLHLIEVPAILSDIGKEGYNVASLKDLALGRINDEGLQRIKEIEKTTNHDVKAVEYFIREVAFDKNHPSIGFIHFACTSEDINNLAYNLMLRDVLASGLVPAMQAICEDLRGKIKATQNLPMLSRTHGQTASPTTVGKELAVFAHRLERCLTGLSKIEWGSKFSGAVGNYSAHTVAYPELDWEDISKNFIERQLGFKHNPLTTQIENHDSVTEMLDLVRRFDVILLGFCRDMWGYVSLGYFKQRAVAGEVGSSTMPHKVNPIDFENAEGNLGLAISLCQHLAEKLPISRWQRDLSDSTALRSLGTVVGYSLLAFKSCLRGLGKVEVDAKKLQADLESAWEVLSEPLQVVMKRFGVADAYERLKDVSRGKAFDQAQYLKILEACEQIPESVKKRMRVLTPETYLGVAGKLAGDFLSRGKV